MLLNKSYTSGDIVCLKLISGEELIARFETETVESVELHKPLAVTLSQNGLGMVPWLFLGGKDTLKIKHSHVMTMVECKKDAADQYRVSTTGLSVA